MLLACGHSSDFREFVAAMNGDVAAGARSAATVMLVRDRGGIEVFLARRSSASRFMPGASVFPGGAVDAADGGDPAVAAARELFEEAGVLLSCDAQGRPAIPDSAARRVVREAMHGGADFGLALRQAGLRIDRSSLVPYSRWITPIQEPIRFDTHFFLARSPSGQEPEADARELHDGRWWTPQEAMRRADAGELTIFFPTRKHLERLNGFANVESLMDHARGRTIAPLLVRLLAEREYALPSGMNDW